MGRSESSVLARKSWISGVGYLCDMVGRLSVSVCPTTHGQFYGVHGVNDSKPTNTLGKIQNAD